ncbi:PspC domain-containing protein [Flavobacterium sp. F372]|uniref:PspC domain-containing protein n=1 Tax=Flavobacterium bernardetii TaxID=2813823 RepID=A0ABR7IVG3_9FLAO|nr:PspC domain-containing protein [Flavobacterium bernardetii]MBC5833492.1 PspC domain-containing protein [Flavobacterium bernardetii]NHF68724.1 PspC domain-containing protein [Flavobacterium bernardetii]
MNKTTSINLGGYFFHIDEDAFKKLSNYFDAVRRSLSPDGREEIIKDIESRISEIFTEKLGTTKQVIGLKEVDDVIAIMGQPEDYKIEDETPKNEYYSSYSNSGASTKKLYRDKENSLLGGVMSGLGHYFGVDPLWLRIIMVILFFGFGTGLVLYLILWILVPEAITTSQKLEMRGEPITISNIEKKVKEGFSEISDKFSNLDHDKIAANAKYGAERVGSTLSDIIVTLFKAFGKVLGFFILLFATVSFLGVVIGSIVLLFTSTLPEIMLHDNFHTPFNFDIPLWAQGLFVLFTIGIPLFFFVLVGLRLLIPNTKSIGNYAKYTLLALWLFSIVALGFVGANYATEISHDGKVSKKELLPIVATDTLEVKFATNDFFSKSNHDNSGLRITQDSAKHDIIYSNNVNFHLKYTDKKQPYVIVEKTAQGKNFDEANKRAEKIKYNFKFVGKQLLLDNYFLTDVENKFRGQEVDIYLYMPEGMVYYPNKNVERYLSGHNSDYDYGYGPEGFRYKVTENELKCLDCPIDTDNEDEETHIENVSGEIIGDNRVETTKIENDSIEKVSVKVNGKEIINTEVRKSKN